MTAEEFSNGFDTLINAYTLKADFGYQSALADIAVNEYEKSVFLTQSQEELIKALYTGKNSSGDSFEGTEELRRYLSNLISEANLEPITTTSGNPLGIEGNSKFFTLPDDLWFITYESAKIENSRCAEKNKIKVCPTRQDEYQSIKDNPFRGANNRRALRFDLSDGVVEIVSKLAITEYYVRYIKKLPPIVLIDLSDGLSINGVVEKSEYGEEEKSASILHEALHSKVLEMAVMMAIRSKGYNIQNK